MEGNVDEYPKKMRRTDGEVVTVLAAPSPSGVVPYQTVGDDGGTTGYGLIHFDCLTPLPSPDDEVEVVVRMTRAQRDDVVRVSDGLRVREARRALVAACRAHRDAEQAEGGTDD